MRNIHPSYIIITVLFIVIFASLGVAGRIMNTTSTKNTEGSNSSRDDGKSPLQMGHIPFDDLRDSVSPEIPNNAPPASPNVPPPDMSCIRSVFYTPIADAYVVSSDPDRNYGSTDGMGVGYGPDDFFAESYIKFDLANAPQKDFVYSRLLLRVGNGGQGPALFFKAPSSWSEHEITYNNKPAPYTQIHTSEAIISNISGHRNLVTVASEEYQIYIKENIGKQFSFAITSGSMPLYGNFAFWTKEYTERYGDFDGVDYTPQLELMYSTPGCN